MLDSKESRVEAWIITGGEDLLWTRFFLSAFDFRLECGNLGGCFTPKTSVGFVTLHSRNLVGVVRVRLSVFVALGV